MMKQEDFPEDELVASKTKLYPWERQRGERVPIGVEVERRKPVATTPPISQSAEIQAEETPSPTPYPAVMPGGRFYVDQHVSRGHFGRDANVRTSVVYDPNILMR